MLHVPPCPRGLKVSVPSLRVSGKVSCAALVGGGKNERLSGEDTAEDTVAGGNDRLKELDERVLDSVVAVDKEELGRGAVQAVEWHLRCLDQVTAGT
jgi:hypothetical protein